MIRIWVAAAALLALTVLYPAREAGAEAEAGGNAMYCHWYRQQARNTGDEYWWDRWRRCMRGDYWERPGSKPRTGSRLKKTPPG